MANAAVRDIVVRFHERYPGISHQLFSELRADDGRSSYDFVADAALAGLHAPAVLDLGCGDGAVLRAIAERDPAASLHGIDFVASEIAIARERLPQGEFVVGDLDDPLPYANARFDAVTANLVVMLLGDVDRLLASTASALRDGGRFVFTIDALQRASNAYVDALREALSAIGMLTNETRFDTASDARVHDAVTLGTTLAQHGLTLISDQCIMLNAPADEEFIVGLMLASYPLGLLSDALRTRAREAVRSWHAREKPVVSLPLRLVVAERNGR